MLGNLAEALLTLGMVAVGPAAIALIVALVLRLAKSHGRGTTSVSGHPEMGRQAPAFVYVVLSAFVGAAAAYISLEAFYGVALAVAAAMLLFHKAARHRWFALGGFLLGMGLCAAGFLSAALTNRDPAVTYDPSTIPSFWIGVGLALCGAVTLVAATTAHPRRGSA